MSNEIPGIGPPVIQVNIKVNCPNSSNFLGSYRYTNFPIIIAVTEYENDPILLSYIKKKLSS